jgi:hypothetical protein
MLIPACEQSCELHVVDGSDACVASACAFYCCCCCSSHRAVAAACVLQVLTRFAAAHALHEAPFLLLFAGKHLRQCKMLW